MRLLREVFLIHHHYPVYLFAMPDNKCCSSLCGDLAGTFGSTTDGID